MVLRKMPIIMDMEIIKATSRCEISIFFPDRLFFKNEMKIIEKSSLSWFYNLTKVLCEQFQIKKSCLD